MQDSSDEVRTGNIYRDAFDRDRGRPGSVLEEVLRALGRSEEEIKTALAKARGTPDRLVSLAGAERKLRCPKRRILLLVREGKLRAIHFSRTVVFQKSELDRFVEEQGRVAGQAWRSRETRMGLRAKDKESTHGQYDTLQGGFGSNRTLDLICRGDLALRTEEPYRFQVWKTMAILIEFPAVEVPFRTALLQNAGHHRIQVEVLEKEAAGWRLKGKAALEPLGAQQGGYALFGLSPCVPCRVSAAGRGEIWVTIGTFAPTVES